MLQRTRSDVVPTLEACWRCESSVRSSSPWAALAWWRGAAFEEFAAEPFAMAEARRLEEVRLGARVDRAGALLDVGAIPEGVGTLEALVAEEPLHERAWELLVQALGADGRSADAVRAAQRCRRELAEVGLEPSAAVVRAEEAALSGEARLLHGRAERRRSALPRGIGRFVGRGAELARLEKLVQPGCCLALVGPGGVGKSRLAIEVAGALADRFSAGAFVCDLTSVEQAESVVPQLGATLGAPLTAPLAERLIRFCEHRSLLVVLDDCEHLIDEASRVARLLLDAAPGVAIVVTSREPLRIAREHVVRLQPLAPEDAVRLYQLRSAAAGAMTDDPVAIEELCRHLDNLPLGIEMAAGWSRSLTARELAPLVAEDRSLLSHRARDVVSRHRSFDSAVGWSYELLPDDERRLYERLSVFAGSVDLDSALAVAAPDTPLKQSARLLMDLVDRSLVLSEHAGGETRFRMLETTRAFAAHALRRRGEQPAALADHATWATRLAGQIATGYRTADARWWAERAERMLPELRAAVYRCIERGPIELALEVVAALALPVYEWLRADISRWARHSVEAAAAAGVDVPPEARVCAALGALQGGQFDEAFAMVESAPGAFAAIVRADAALYSGHYERCGREALVAIEAAEEEGDAVLLTLALLDLALAVATAVTWRVPSPRWHVCERRRERLGHPRRSAGPTSSRASFSWTGSRNGPDRFSSERSAMLALSATH